MKKIKFKSVKTKLFLIFTTIMIVPATILGISSYLKVFNTLKMQKTSETVQINKQIEYSLNEFTSSLNKTETLLAKSPVFVDMVNSEESGEASDTMLIKPEVSTMRAMLSNLVDSNGNVKAAYIATRNKNMYSGKVKALYAEKKTYDPTTSEWYKNAASQDKILWTKPYLDNNKNNKEPITVVTLSKAIERNGTMYGAVAMDINLNELIKKINGIKIGQSGFVYVTNSNGEILIHSDKKKIRKLVESTELLDSLKKAEGNLRTKTDGKEYITSFETEPNTNWKVICNLPVSELNQGAVSIKKFMIIIGIITIIIALIIASYVSTNMVIKHLDKLKEVLRKSSKGDLTAQVYIKTEDEFSEIGEGYNNMTLSISTLVDKVKEYSKVITEQSSSLKETAAQTQVATNDAVINISEISKASISQVSSTEKSEEHISHLAENIENVSTSISVIGEMLKETQEINEKGIYTVKTLTDKTQNTIAAEERLTKMVLEVDNSSMEIAIISEAINEISEQTNLLSLNASIEAARAGEAGKGFAVVAEEVRKLAEESAAASSKIQNLVKKIQVKSKNAVASISSNEQIFKEQNNAVNDTKSIFEDISSNIQRLYNEAKQVNNLNKEMVDNKNFMVKIIEDIYTSSKHTSASTEQMSASTEETLAMIEEFNSHTEQLNKLAENLEESIAKFKTQL
ncbi:hypothetical protein HBE96_17480 [Clostridium sp. P21]|uniref:Methyl-accepting chemotaxis protein n=1 Tax=Clostridium muellerianum TaxID=2716538 RepID=A0A7Y0EJ41_9CLOT|nr:methyl-accepting chemotaxis protein [Clostridium muellerianum]NMM64414.1 hypothetical protein [Clostridium muellerianum]